MFIRKTIALILALCTLGLCACSMSVDHGEITFYGGEPKAAQGQTDLHGEGQTDLHGEGQTDLHGEGQTDLDGEEHAGTDWPKTEPIRTDRLQIGEKEYEAVYYGIQDLSNSGLPCLKREFWRLEDAYEDFASCPLTGEVLPYDNYPMQIEEGQVFVLDYTLTDGTVERKLYRSDGLIWNDMPSTQAFTPDADEQG